MHYHHYTAIPVIDHNGVYQGTMTEGDFLWYILNRNRENDAIHCDIRTTEHTDISGLIRKDFNPPVNIYASMEDLLQRVMDQNFVPVIDDRGVFVGIITRKDVIRYFVENAYLDTTQGTHFLYFVLPDVACHAKRKKLTRKTKKTLLNTTFKSVFYYL